MVVKICLSRFSCRNKPFCLGLLQSIARDGGKHKGLNFNRVKYWMSVGGQPSEPVQLLLFRAGLLPPPSMLAMAQKGGPRDPRPIDPMNGCYLTPESPQIVNQAEDREGNGSKEGDKPSQ